jgi:hypothetical protein
MTKRERFQKVAVARTQKVLDDMNLLSHCSRTTMYEYTPDEVAQIMDSLDSALAKLKAAFEGEKQFSLAKEE